MLALGKTQVGADLGLHHPGKSQGQHTQWTATDHDGAPTPCPCSADPPQRAEGVGKQSQPVLVADWPGKILPIDLPTATKAQLQEEDVLRSHKRCTSSTQLGC